MIKRLLVRNYRLLPAFVIIAISIILIYHRLYDKNKLNVPYDTEYGVVLGTLELDDYTISYEIGEKGLVYYVTSKKSGDIKPLFNHAIEDENYDMVSVSKSGNKIFFMERRKLYCYDVSTDELSVVYEYPITGERLKVFDVLVINRCATPEVRETVINALFVARGQVVIEKDSGIDIYDGKTTTSLLDGKYHIVSYKDGIMKLSKAVDYESKLYENYEYDIDSKTLRRVDIE